MVLGTGGQALRVTRGEIDGDELKEHPTGLARVIPRALQGLVVALAIVACGGGAAGGLPSGEHLHSLAVTGEGDLLLGFHGGLYRSEDGTAWDLVGLEGKDAMVIASAATPIFVAGHDVLVRSDDGGNSFQEMRPADLPGLDLHAFAQAPTDGEVIYAFAVGYGLFSSIDAGETWEARAPLGNIAVDTLGLAVVGPDTDTLVSVGPDSGILRTEDGGNSFYQVLAVPAWAVTVDTDDPNRVWALTVEGLQMSDDAGATWSPISALEGVDGQPATLATDSGVLWLAAEEPRAVWRSNDGGVSWERIAGS